MRVIKSAKIEVVSARDLKEKDEILWSNMRCKIDKIDWNTHEIYFSDINNYAGSLHFKFYRNYYKLISYKEINVCLSCGKTITNNENFCEECKKSAEFSLSDDYI